MCLICGLGAVVFRGFRGVNLRTDRSGGEPILEKEHAVSQETLKTLEKTVSTTCFCPSPSSSSRPALECRGPAEHTRPAGRRGKIRGETLEGRGESNASKQNRGVVDSQSHAS